MSRFEHPCESEKIAWAYYVHSVVVFTDGLLGTCTRRTNERPKATVDDGGGLDVTVRGQGTHPWAASDAVFVGAATPSRRMYRTYMEATQVPGTSTRTSCKDAQALNVLNAQLRPPKSTENSSLPCMSPTALPSGSLAGYAVPDRSSENELHAGPPGVQGLLTALVSLSGASAG